MKYRPEIDGLRALAVVPVIAYHAGFAGFSGGFLGVDVFFVLSGYLITSILCEEHSKGTFSVAKFYERRARRILPALFVVLVACLPFAWFWLVPGDMQEFSRSLLAVLAFVSNIFFWRDSSDYFSTAAELKPLLHTWSLGVEEQFYIFYPLALAAIWRFGRQWLPLLMAVAALASLALAQWLVVTRPTAAFYLLPTRAWELLLGGLVSVYMRDHPLSPRRWLREGASFVGLAMLVSSVVAFRRDAPTPGVLTLVPTAGTALLILFASPSTLVGRILSLRWLVTIGLVSYSAYLWHQPLFVFARHGLLGKPGFPLMFSLAVASLALAYVTWRIVEQPFRNRARVQTGTVVRWAIASTLLLGIFGAAGAGTDGFRAWKVDARAAGLLSTAIPSPLREACHIRSALRQPDKPCEYFFSPPTWAVLGDSHAVELSYALAEALKPSHQGLRHYSRSSCGPEYMDPGDPSDCRRWTRQVLEELAADKHIANVVVSYRLNLYLTGPHKALYPEQPDDYTDTDRRNRLVALSRVLQELIDTGKRVVLVLQAPELPKRMENLALVSGIGADGTVTGASRAWWDQRNRYVQAFVPYLPHQVTVIDPADFFCDEVTCFAAKDGISLYFDDNHMSVAGAAVVVSHFYPSTPGNNDGTKPRD